MDFQELGLNAELVRAVRELDFVTPMPIQEKAIPVLLDGRQDVVGLAQTGTGKTGAFGLPLLQRIDRSIPRPQAVILCPTRELCIQIAADIKRFSRHMKGVHTVAVYGGASIAVQMLQIKRGAHIIAATPGRLIDLLQRKVVDMSRVSVAILDEADEMLNMGFQEDIDRILGTLPSSRRIWLFSATMPSGVAAIADRYLADPVNITVGGKHRSPKNIGHTCYTIREKDRYEALKRVLDFFPGIFGLIFCRTRKQTQDVAAGLVRDGYDADALHGDLSQAQRAYVMGKFRNASIRILVATDVAARGLDVDDITHVIHYNLPDETDVYTHRSGRTARAGKYGASIALINVKEKYRIRAIEKRCKIRFDFKKLPDGKEICRKQLLDQVGKIIDAEVNDADIADYMPDIYEALGGMDKEELIKRFVSSGFNRFIEYYRHAADINVKPRETSGTCTRAKTGPAKPAPGVKNRMKGRKTRRFFINVGRLDKINAGAIVRLVCDQSGIRSDMIGQIDLKREFSFFEVEQQAAGRVRRSVRNARFDGRAVRVREVSEKNSGGQAIEKTGRRNKRRQQTAAM
ncbi:MAG: ATP-dependent helicase [Deltaproteobacteria bacterium]|nr:MAG: ATP-dependent helicase [Deltaproteobacteria bacterium]